MKRYLIAATVIVGGLLIPATAHAATDGPACTVPSGWYVNDDETDRVPTPVTGGLKFEGNDLIHHAADTTVETLTPGAFVADPAPDQISFFSVEVSGDGKYGTLRWNTTEQYWEATSQGLQLHDVNPAALADAFPIHLSHHVVSFGVGYTANPPGTMATTVSSVTFAGKTYDLTCKPPVSASASPSASTSHTASPTVSAKPSHTTGHTPDPSRSTPVGALAITGAPVGPILFGGVGAVALGVLLAVFATRRRRTRFTA